MIIEVTGTSTWNKGAELMLCAILDRYRRHVGLQVAVDSSFGPYSDRSGYGLLNKVRTDHWDRTRLGMTVLSSNFRKVYGMVLDEDIDVVLDASGFAFGDQHPVERTEEFAGQVFRWSKFGIPVILLPQALGPFEKPGHRKAFRGILEDATHIFVRDDESHEHIRTFDEYTPDRVSQAPDFTNLLHVAKRKVSGDELSVCIVPNQRMIEKAESGRAADAYVPFLLRTLDISRARGLEPFLLVHSDTDDRLIADLLERSSHDVRVVRKSDPLEIKAILGSVSLVVASRYHALISALSQAVPAIGTSWSHKYRELFVEYDCADLILPVTAGMDVLERAFDLAAGPDRGRLVDRLEDRAGQLRAETENMWMKVDSLCGLGSRV